MQTVKETPHEVVPVFQQGNIIDGSREKVAEFALKNNCTHLFFVDSDMYFNGSTLSRLLALDKDIVGAMYNFRTLPIQTTAKLFEDFIPNEPFKVYGLGMGCILIKTEVFKKLKKPYFLITRDEHGDAIHTEDVYFSEKAREAGIDTWCDPSLEVKHIGDYLY